MYGVTESEKYHLLSPVDLMHGMSEGQRDAILKEHAKVHVASRFDFFLRPIFSAVGSVGIPSFLPGFVIYRGEKLVYAWAGRCGRKG